MITTVDELRAAVKAVFDNHGKRLTFIVPNREMQETAIKEVKLVAMTEQALDNEALFDDLVRLGFDDDQAGIRVESMVDFLNNSKVEYFMVTAQVIVGRN